jgi:carbonic anhydrase
MFEEVGMIRRILILTIALVSFPVLAVRAQVQTKESQAAITPTKALELLKEGNARFVAGKRTPRDLNAQVAAAVAGQYPYAVIVSCMDSRVPAELVFDLGIGDVFSVRVAGNVIDTDSLGSLEYAAKVIGVKSILVLGHSDCGAIKGAIDDVKLGNLTALLAKIQPAIGSAGAPRGTSKDKAFVGRVAEQNVRLGMKEIRKKSPVLREMIESGKVGLAGGMYDLATGKVTLYAD